MRDHLYWDDAVYREHLARRRPDLLVLAYGTNESGDDDVPLDAYEERLPHVLTRTREVARGASCLLIGPSDRPLRNDDGTFADRVLTGQIIDSPAPRVRGATAAPSSTCSASWAGRCRCVSWVAAVPPLAHDRITCT